MNVIKPHLVQPELILAHHIGFNRNPTGPSRVLWARPEIQTSSLKSGIWQHMILPMAGNQTRRLYDGVKISDSILSGAVPNINPAVELSDGKLGWTSRDEGRLSKRCHLIIAPAC